MKHNALVTFWLSCPVLFFSGTRPGRTVGQNDFHALWFTRRVSVWGGAFWEL